MQISRKIPFPTDTLPIFYVWSPCRERYTNGMPYKVENHPRVPNQTKNKIKSKSHQIIWVDKDNKKV
jgi:hypothetical protein